MKLNQMFTDNMVFQANKPIRIFGEGKGTVSVEFSDNKVTEICKEDKWIIELPSMNYGGPYEFKIYLNEEEIILKDIYIGDVFLLAGQSNIELSLEFIKYPEEKLEGCPLVRAYMQDRVVLSPNIKSVDGWMICGETEKLKYWSALGYHTALNISKKKNVAVGLVFCYKGASIIESWLPEYIVGKEEYRIPYEERYLSRSACKDEPHNKTSALYYNTQQKIVPFSFSSVIWYQGESNTGSGEYKIYGSLLKELIFCWRNDFKDPDLPFIVIVIADFDERDDDGWKNIQQIQKNIQNEIKNVISVESADVCESSDIHPPTKTLLAERIAEIILKQ